MDHHRVVDTVLQMIWSEWVMVVASVSAMASSSKEVAVEFGEPVLVVAFPAFCIRHQSPNGGRKSGFA